MTRGVIRNKDETYIIAPYNRLSGQQMLSKGNQFLLQYNQSQQHEQLLCLTSNFLNTEMTWTKNVGNIDLGFVEAQIHGGVESEFLLQMNQQVSYSARNGLIII